MKMLYYYCNRFILLIWVCLIYYCDATDDEIDLTIARFSKAIQTIAAKSDKRLAAITRQIDKVCAEASGNKQESDCYQVLKNAFELGYQTEWSAKCKDSTNLTIHRF